MSNSDGKKLDFIFANFSPDLLQTFFSCANHFGFRNYRSSIKVENSKRLWNACLKIRLLFQDKIMKDEEKLREKDFKGLDNIALQFESNEVIKDEHLQMQTQSSTLEIMGKLEIIGTLPTKKKTSRVLYYTYVLLLKGKNKANISLENKAYWILHLEWSIR